MDNSIKFTKPDGRIVRAEKRGGDRVRITVEDDGAGIPPRRSAIYSTGSTGLTRPAPRRPAAAASGLPS